MAPCSTTCWTRLRIAPSSTAEEHTHGRRLLQQVRPPESGQQQLLFLVRGEDHTITLTTSDETPAPEDEVSVALDDLPEGVGMLVVKRGPGAGSRFVLEGDVVSAGRHPDSTIFLDDVTVSRRHAEVVRSGTGYALRDVGSLNGT